MCSDGCPSLPVYSYSHNAWCVFPRKNNWVTIPYPKCTGSCFFLSVSIQKSTNTIITKRTVIMQMKETYVPLFCWTMYSKQYPHIQTLECHLWWSYIYIYATPEHPWSECQASCLRRALFSFILRSLDNIWAWDVHYVRQFIWWQRGKMHNLLLQYEHFRDIIASD